MLDVARLLPSLERSGNVIRDAWDRLAPLPGGKQLFSRFIGFLVPYTGSMRPHVVRVERGASEVFIEDHRAVRNHLRSVHAIALANLAELTGNRALAYSVPDDGRFIVSKLTIEYAKKARGRITGTCDCPVPETSERREYVVPVTLRDESGDTVATATLLTLVGPKKRGSG